MKACVALRADELRKDEGSGEYWRAKATESIDPAGQANTESAGRQPSAVRSWDQAYLFNMNGVKFWLRE
jgi:hypothetical protein